LTTSGDDGSTGIKCTQIGLNNINSLPPDALCATEETGNVAATFKYNGTTYSITKDTMDLLGLTKLDAKYVNGKDDLYINARIAQAIGEAYSSCNECFKISMAYRTCAQQKAVCNNVCGCEYGCKNGVSACPPKSTDTCGKPGRSNHQKGLAIDVTGNNGRTCGGSKGCDLEIVNALEATGALKHYNECNTISESYEDGTDCVHFSFNGK